MNPRPEAARWEGRRQVSDGIRSVRATLGRRLHQRTPLGRIIQVTSGGAALVGALMGGAALAFWTDTSLSGWFVGTLSSAVVGGFVGFLLACFLEMTIRAWWQAAETGRRED
jgi:hypothetical protein